MSSLPASVRVALWGTAALAGHCNLQHALSQALPDPDHVEGLAEPVQVWADLGQQIIGVALPQPGHPGLLPGSPPGSAFSVAATDAGECVFVPGLGGALVPRHDEFGPSGDTGWAVRWTQYDTEPVAVHRLSALHEREIDRALRATLVAATRDLEGLDAGPWTASARRAGADAAGLTLWGLPPGIPGGTVRLIQQAGLLSHAAEQGRQHGTTDAMSTGRRERVLLDLQVTAQQALEQASTLAALHLAGLRG